jgi:hypothetical protein
MARLEPVYILNENRFKSEVTIDGLPTRTIPQDAGLDEPTTLSYKLGELLAAIGSERPFMARVPGLRSSEWKCIRCAIFWPPPER